MSSYDFAELNKFGFWAPILSFIIWYYVLIFCSQVYLAQNASGGFGQQIAELATYLENQMFMGAHSKVFLLLSTFRISYLCGMLVWMSQDTFRVTCILHDPTCKYLDSWKILYRCLYNAFMPNVTGLFLHHLDSCVVLANWLETLT